MAENNSQAVALKGLRRELTRETFEELGAIQCTPDEIAGYVGTTRRKLEAWCRKTYRCSLDQMLDMTRQDGLIAIRRASFDLLKKSAAIVAQQYNRFLPNAGADRADSAALRALAEAVAPSPDRLREIFAGPEEEE